MDKLNDKFKKSAENFSLIPSTNIWLNVEAAIRKRKRKRILILFFFIGAALLIGGVVLLSRLSTTINSEVILKKDDKAMTAPKTERQSILTAGNRLAAEKNLVLQNSLAKKKQSTNYIIQKQKLPYSYISNAAIDIASISETVIDTNQNNIIYNNSIQNEIAATITTAVLPVVVESVKPDSAYVITKDTLQQEILKDTLIKAGADSVKSDTLIALKDSLKSKTQKKRWSIAIGIAPSLSFTKPQEEGDSLVISNYRDSSDKILLTWNYHFSANYKIIPQLAVFTGIGIINFEQKILSKQLVFDYDTVIIVSSGPSGPDTIITLGTSYFNIHGDSTGTITNKFSYFEIPVGVRYTILPEHKFSIALETKVSFNKLNRHNGYIYNYQNFNYEKIKRDDLEKWLISYGIGVSFQYAVRKNLLIELVPYYKNFQKSIYKATYPMKQRLQQVELRLSIHYLVK